ncbi:hypothetical protein ABES25_18955 [Bacillus gobiensis]|uniref:hypothetical protein n=1 Tax=Bacillus gobiensis TaxID=1441095 RepID=UPI003D240893
MRRRKVTAAKMIFFFAAVAILCVLAAWFVHSISKSEQEQVIDKFYKSEQEGDFGSSWNLFHSSMKDRFSKNAYVTERSHIYMGHFGVQTFDYEIGNMKKIDDWQNPGTSQKETVYQTEVKLLFKSKFGTFSILQKVYVVKEKEKWVVLWEYENR